MLPQFTWPWALYTLHPKDCLTFGLVWRKIQICFKLIVRTTAEGCEIENITLRGKIDLYYKDSHAP